eukprot:1399730-Amphidinium_carterae.1
MIFVATVLGSLCTNKSGANPALQPNIIVIGFGARPFCESRHSGWLFFPNTVGVVCSGEHALGSVLGRNLHNSHDYPPDTRVCEGCVVKIANAVGENELNLAMHILRSRLAFERVKTAWRSTCTTRCGPHNSQTFV